MWRIKCSNGEYITKTHGGTHLSFNSRGKVWQSENLVIKNIELCEYCVEKYDSIEGVDTYTGLTFEIEPVG